MWEDCVKKVMRTIGPGIGWGGEGAKDKGRDGKRFVFSGIVLEAETDGEEDEGEEFMSILDWKVLESTKKKKK